MLKTKRFWYILLFSVLYLIVAGSSFWHAIAFFGLANNTVMSIILAFAFEVGQAAVLFSLLTSKKDRNRIIPWALMTMFTLVQVIGNVYSSYKYIISNSVADLRYFKEPIFIWTQLPDDQATVIITYVVGAILPIAALLLVLCGICTSIMWGSIFNLAVEGLGKYTEAASGIFMMLVVGGGILPLIQNFIADASTYMFSYIVILLGLAYMLYYAAIGSKNVNKDIKID